MPIYNAIVSIYVVENGFIVKDGNVESAVSKKWVARTDEELAKVIRQIVKNHAPAILKEGE